MGSSGYNPNIQRTNIQQTSSNELPTNYIKIDEEQQKIYNSIPKDQFICPACGEIPELINIHTDNGCIEFKCKSHGQSIITIDQYFKKLSESNFTYYKTKCCICNKMQKNYIKKEQIFKYCYICKKDYCYECVNKQEHPKSHIKQCISINEKCIRCPDHFKEVYTSFCSTCQENICEENSSKMHKGHKKIDFFKIDTKKKEIINKNKILSDIIKFNELILNTYEKLPDNYFNIINLYNLIESIKAENSRDSKELEQALKMLEAKINLGKSAIENFNKKYKMSLTGNEKEVSLKNKGLNDEDVKVFSMIYFKNLKDLDLSENKIKDINFFKDMNTSNLEYLNLGHNQIEVIQILENLNLQNLKELGLQNNKIKNVSSLLKANLSSLELLRLEGNDGIDRSMSDFKKILKKYTKKLVYLVQTFEDFNKKYDVKISEESKEINLRQIKKGNDILKDLYILSSNYDNVRRLDLSGCKIDNIFELSRMSFKKLETLDLSCNEIKKIDILTTLKCKNLKSLFLNDNQIRNIAPLKYLKFNSLKTISIKDNNYISTNQEVIKVKAELDKKKIANDIDENEE